MQEALDEVRSAVARVRGDLPGDVRDPIVNKVDLAAQPVLAFAIASPRMDAEALSWFVDDTVARRLLAARGVGAVNRVGGADRQVRVALDPARLQELLGAASGRFDVDALAACESTSTLLLARAEKGAPAGAVIVADRQTAGRGSRGRRWLAAPEASLTFSRLWRFAGGVERLSGLSLAVGVAVVRALESLGATGVTLKWPNDILVDRRKVCGILIEGETLPDGRHGLVLGIGINVAVAPDAGLYPVATLREFGATASPEELFAHLFQSMATTLSLWDGGQGIVAIMERWKRVAGGIGENITVNLPDRSISGRFSGRKIPRIFLKLIFLNKKTSSAAILINGM